MTEVSELSFSKGVNDFKVAPAFVLNCRAGKWTTFALAEVERLFQPDEGPISEQVRLLERLGFLERVVVDTGAGAVDVPDPRALHPLLGAQLIYVRTRRPT